MELVSNASAQLFPENKNSALLQNYYGSNWMWKVNGRLQFRKYLTHQCTKMWQRKISCFLTKNFESCRNSLPGTWSSPFYYRYLLKPWKLSLKKDTITARIVSPLKCLKERKMLKCSHQMKNLVLHSVVRIWDTFPEVFLAWDLEVFEKKSTSQTKFHDIVRIHPFNIYMDLIEYNINGDKKAPLLRCFPFNSKLKTKHDNYLTVHELLEL